MAKKFTVTKKWADSVAEGKHELFSAEGFQPQYETGMKSPPIPITCLAEMYRDGQSQAEVLAKLGISYHMYNKACCLSPKFNLEHEHGLLLSEAWWCGLGRLGAAGKIRIQANAWAFNMKNRFAWSDKRDLTAKPDGGDFSETNITPEMTPEEAAKIYHAEILKKV